MTPLTIIRAAQAEGVRLTLSPAGTIKATGDGAAVNRWLETIREHRAEIIDVLKADSATSWGWLLHFADRDPLEVYCNPDANHAGILDRYPHALAGAPISERITPTDTEAVAWSMLTTPEDDRRTCGHCANLAGRRCLAAWRREIVANRDYEPIGDIPRRCEGYTPGANDPDKRLGMERCPELMQKGSK